MSRDAPAAPIRVFNSPVEAGLRALCVLVESFPHSCDLERLTFLDYFVVHSGDIEGGPLSLHPPIPHRAGEVLVRRALVEEGVLLVVGRGLACVQFDACGIAYRASEDAAAFLKCLEAEYTRTLRDRARWIVAHFADSSTEQLKTFVAGHLGDWGAEIGVRITGYEVLE